MTLEHWDRLLSNDDAAHMLGITPETLKNWRSNGRGKTYPKHDHGPTFRVYAPTNRFCGYLLSDVLAYIEESTLPRSNGTEVQ